MVAAVVVSGGAAERRGPGGGAGRARYAAGNPASVGRTSTPTAAFQKRADPNAVVGAAAVPAGVAAGPRASFITYRTVETSAMRALRSFSRQRRTTVRLCGGTSAGNALKSGSLLSTVAGMSDPSSPSNAPVPARVS